jgi:hypothetical protein
VAQRRFGLGGIAPGISIAAIAFAVLAAPVSNFSIAEFFLADFLADFIVVYASGIDIIDAAFTFAADECSRIGEFESDGHTSSWCGCRPQWAPFFRGISHLARTTERACSDERALRTDANSHSQYA